MADPIDALILDLLESIAAQPKPYSEVMSAWRTSCPRLPVWEEATDRGFIERRGQEGGAVVCLTAVGREFLDRHGGPKGTHIVECEQTISTQALTAVRWAERGPTLTNVYTAPHIALVTPVKNLLEANGIPCILRNDFLSAGRGEIPSVDTWPEVWVTNDSDAERARGLVAEATREADPAAKSWRCTHCGEDADAVFAQCWNCGAER